MKTVFISFTPEQLQVVNEGLVNLPFKLSAPLISHINAEIQKQFDIAKGDDPTGQTVPKDQFSGD